MNLKLGLAAAAGMVVLSLCACGAKTSGSSAGSIPPEASGAVPAPMATATCTPVPLPTPQVDLINPASESTSVPRNVGTVRFEIMSGSTTATKLSLKPPAGKAVNSTSVKPVGTPGPNGQRQYEASISDLLLPRTKYHVYVSGVQTFGGCGEKYRSPSSFFKTGAKRK